MKKTIIPEDKFVLGTDMSLTRRLFNFLCILSLYFMYCYNFMLGAFIRPTLTTTYGFSLAQAAQIFAFLGFASIIGAVLAGKACSKFGKKNTLMGLGLFFGTMTMLPLLQPASLMLWITSRSLAGFALGGVFGTAHPLVYDMFPQRFRGKLAAMCTGTFAMAMIVGGQVYGLLGDENWRLLVMTAAVPPFISVVLIFFFVPSDTKLIAQYRAEAAAKKTHVGYWEMYQGKYFFIGAGAILLSGLNFIAYSGYSNNAITYFTTVQGMTSAVAGTIFSMQGFGILLGYFTWGYLSDKFGRKTPIIGFIMAVCGILIITRMSPENVSALKFVSFMLGFSFGFSGAWGAYYTELFPHRFRAMAAGVSFNCGRIISMFGLPLVAGIAATSYGMVGVFTASACVGIAGIVVWSLLPETLGKKAE